MEPERPDTEHVVAELQRLDVEHDNALQNEASTRSDVQNPTPLEDTESDADKVNQIETELAEKESLIDKMSEKTNNLKEEVGKRKESEKNLSDDNENMRREILKLKDEKKRLEDELRLQKDLTATDEVVKLRNELWLAMETEESSKQAMDELALVIREVAAESNTIKQKLASAEEQVKISREEIDRLKAEAEESSLAWDDKEMELVKCLKEEEDVKAKLKEENRKIMESLSDLERNSKKLIEDTEKLKDAFKESFEEAEMAKAESLELKECLMQNEKRLMLFTQENERLRAVNDNIEEKWPVPSSTRKELKSHDAEDKKAQGVEEEQKTLACSPSKQEMKPHGGAGENPKKLAHSCSKKESKSHGGAEEKAQKKASAIPSKKEEKEQKALVIYSKMAWVIPSTKKETKSTTGAEEKDQKKASGIPSKKDTKSTTGAEEKEQKKASGIPSKKETKSTTGAEEKALIVYSKKDPKASNGGEEKDYKKIKKDSSQELKGGIPRTKSAGLMCFDPMVMLPIPGISKYKEAGDSNDDNLTDSIFDIVDPSQPQINHQHRRTASSLEDEKTLSVEEFEHEKKPHLDDMEVERAGTHNTKKGALLKKFGDLWRRKNQGHSQRHHNSQIQSLNQKEVTT